MDALSDIYRRYAPDVYRFSLGLSGDPARAEDLTSETFVRALVSPNPIRTETVKAYLFTIARNLYLQAWHKERRLMRLNENLSDGNPGPEGLAERQDALRAVLDRLQTLPEMERTALLMHAQDGLPYALIASVLGISLASVKINIHRARLKLAQLAQEADP